MRAGFALGCSSVGSCLLVGLGLWLRRCFRGCAARLARGAARAAGWHGSCGWGDAALKGAAQPRCLLGSQLPELLVERGCAQCFASGRSEILRLRVVQYCAMAA